MNTRQPCIYCGDAPVNHRLHFLSATIEILISTIVPPRRRRVQPFFSVEHSPLVRFFSRLFIEIFAFIGIVRFEPIETSHVSARTRSVWNEASKRGIPMESVRILGKEIDEMRAFLPISNRGSKRVWEYFQSLPIPRWKFDTTTWIDDKEAFKKQMSVHCLPVPKGISVLNENAALQAFKTLGKSVIIKPRTGSRARHTTVHITKPEEVIQAFKRAQQLCAFVLVEEYIPGNLYRATCVDGKLIGVVTFIKPHTIADGIHTAEELRILHNLNKKFKTMTDVKADEWFFDALAHQGFTPNDIPPENTFLLLSEHSERPNGGYFIDSTDEIPATTRQAIETAAKVTGATVVGFDLLSEDLTKSEKKFAFIEANSLPYIELHDIPFEGKPRNVAGALWDLWKSDN